MEKKLKKIVKYFNGGIIMEIKTIKIEFPEEINIIFGLKSVNHYLSNKMLLYYH